MVQARSPVETLLWTYFVGDQCHISDNLGQIFTSREPLKNICIIDHGRADGLTVFCLLRFDLMTF